MKKSILFGYIVFLSFTKLMGQQYYMTAPEGFGAGATGGGTGTPTTVTTYAALKTALTSSTTAAVILVSGTIDFSTSGMIKAIIKNKTLIGLPGARFVNTNQTVSGILYLSNGSTNIIIRNLVFEGPSAMDNNGNDNLTADGCTNLWVDHCEFQDGEDGNFDNKGLTDNVTISWSKFTYLKTPRPAGPNGTTNDHRFSDLIGSNGTDAPTDGHYSITFQNCHWAAGCVERMPRSRNAELHILNCYYNSSVGKVALGIGGGTHNSTCYVENSDFTGFGNPASIFKSYDGTDGGSETINFSACLSNPSDIGTVAVPTYTYSAFPVNQVASVIPDPTCGAGATLQVTSGGVISSSCPNIVAGIVSANTSSSPSVIFPNPSSESFNIRGREAIKSLSIINMVGEEVYTESNINVGKDTQIVANFAEGIYIIRIQYISGAVEVVKFVKSK